MDLYEFDAGLLYTVPGYIVREEENKDAIWTFNSPPLVPGCWKRSWPQMVGESPPKSLSWRGRRIRESSILNV